MVLGLICGLFAILCVRHEAKCFMNIIMFHSHDNFRGAGIGASFYGGEKKKLSLE